MRLTLKLPTPFDRHDRVPLHHIAIMTLHEHREWHQKQFASKVLVGLTHLKGSKVAFDNLGRGADKSEGGFDSHYRYN
jgi:hypothetical protein